MDKPMIKNSSGNLKGEFSQHAEVRKPGFPLLDANGRHFGHVDRIIGREGRLYVEGWAFTGSVGLASGHYKTECVPYLVRDDVLKARGQKVGTPGFALDIPLEAHHAILWADVDGIRYVYALPQITPKDLNVLQSA